MPRRRLTPTLERAQREAALIVLVAVALWWPGQVRADVGDRLAFPAFGPEINAPIGARITLLGAEACDATVRYCFGFPLVAFGFDITRPWSPGSRSINLAFAQAPLTGLAGLGALTSRSPTLRAAGVALAVLAGGTFRWAPGGEGNVRGHQGNSEGSSTTVSLVLKNEVAFHPFVRPTYLRITPGAGLALTRQGRSRAGVPWAFTCGAGAFESLAAEYGGRRGWDPGVWLTCLFSAD